MPPQRKTDTDTHTGKQTQTPTQKNRHRHLLDDAATQDLKPLVVVVDLELERRLCMSTNAQKNPTRAFPAGVQLVSRRYDNGTCVRGADWRADRAPPLCCSGRRLPPETLSHTQGGIERERGALQSFIVPPNPSSAQIVDPPEITLCNLVHTRRPLYFITVRPRLAQEKNQAKRSPVKGK